jgi:hypothetical protein
MYALWTSSVPMIERQSNHHQRKRQQWRDQKRRQRRRERDHEGVARVIYTEWRLNVLVHLGYLAEAKSDDPVEIGRAFERMIDGVKMSA